MASKREDGFLSLATHGKVSEILRQIAQRIDTSDVSVESFAVRLQGDMLELQLTFDVTGAKNDPGVRTRGR